MIIFQSGLITATVNQEETPPRDLPCEGPPMQKSEFTHTLFRPLSTPLHVTAHSTDLALGVGRPRGMGDREVPPVEGGRPRDSPGQAALC